MRQVRTDLKMIRAEGKARGGAEVLHRKGNRIASNEQNESAPRTISKGGVDQGAGNENGGERLCKRSRIPGKPDCGRKNAGDSQPHHDLLPRAERAAGNIFQCHLRCDPSVV